jgi:hypothetical protein
MEKKVGTNVVTGLNVAKGPHLIEDHELRESYNGWTDEDGVWRTAPGPERLYSSYTAISCLAAGRMAGVDHVVWLDGNTLYDNGANVGTITAGTTMDIVAMDDVFLILGAAKNYIWDGTHLREQGAWQPDYIYVITEYGPTSGASAETITAITAAQPAVITVGAHDFNVGDRVYIAGIVTGPTELNDRAFTVVAVGATTLSINDDTTTSTAWSAGGTVKQGTALVGEYKYYVTTCIRLADGRVLEGNPRGLRYTSNRLLPITDYDVGPTDSYEPTAITLAAGDWINFGLIGNEAKFYLVRSAVTQFSCTGSYDMGIRIYRTKADGVDFYLEREFFEGDTDVTAFTDANGSGIEIRFYSLGLPDNELGAVYESDLYDHGNAPQSDVGAFAGQRVLIADGHDIYWSDLDGIEYYNNSNGYTPLGDVVTAIAPFRDGWAVFSCDRLWLVQILDGLPSIVEINTPVGTVWPKAMCTVDDGVLFLRDDGLWLFNGARVEKISRGAFPSITSPQSVTAAGELLFVSGSEKSYVAIRRDGGWVWHESEHYRPYADSTNGKIYAAGLFHVEQMFAGRYAGGKLSTKHFGNNWLGKAIRVVLDFEGDTIPTVWVNGNRQSDVLGHVDESSTQYRGRRVVWVSVPRLNNQFLYLTLETTGDCKVYGYEIEVAG